MATNAVATMKTKSNLPTDMQAAFAAELAQIAARVSAPTGNRIRLTQKKTFHLPDGTETPGPISGIIVDFTNANYYYPSGFDPQDIVPADCFALNEVLTSLTPHPNVTEKQAESCMVCPLNQFKSAANGRGKACSNTRLLAVLPADATEASPMMILKVSATATVSFDRYVQQVAKSFGRALRGVLTEFSLAPEKDYASLRFRTEDLMSEGFIEMVNGRREEARQILATPPEARVVVDAPKKAGARRARV